MGPEFQERLAYAAILYPILLFALTFHEFGHAWCAKRLGDRTAEALGRLSMNPIVHIDPIGTVVFPLIMLLSPVGLLFGWAKPVPVNTLNLRKTSDMVLVALAGPACNLILFVIGVIAFKVFVMVADPRPDVEAMVTISRVFTMWIALNLILILFNLLPFTPLDGSKVLLYNIPGHVRSAPFWAAFEQYGPMILIVLWFSGVLWKILEWPMAWTMAGVSWFIQL
jgi:Zn-dependent protease